MVVADIGIKAEDMNTSCFLWGCLGTFKNIDQDYAYECVNWVLLESCIRVNGYRGLKDKIVKEMYPEH